MFNKVDLKRAVGQMQPDLSSRTKVNELYSPGFSMILPPTLTSQSRNQKKGIVFNPLDYEWCEYPQAFTTLINSQPGGQITVKDAGVYNQLFWCFNGIEVLLWRENAQTVTKFSLPQKSQIIAFGELQSAALHFKNQKRIIIAAGIQNYVHLFGIDKETLQCTDFKMLFLIENSSYIQKIIFAENNKILVNSNTGHNLLLDFTSQLKVYRPEGNIIKKSLPYIPLLYPKKQTFCEKLLSSGDYIVSLIREEKKTNWLVFRAKQIVSYAMDNNFNEEWITEVTRVEIYQLNRVTFKISLFHTIKEEDIFIKSKTKDVLRYGQQRENLDLSRIVSINLQEKAPLILQIITKSGIFTKVDLQNDFSIQILPFSIPIQSKIGQVDFYLTKKNLFEEGKEGQSYCLTSLGTNNLTLTQNALWYISQNNIQVVKSNGLSGNLLKAKGKFFNDEEWVLMTKKGYYKIKRIKPSDLISGFLAFKCNKDQQILHKKWKQAQNFQQFLNAMCRSIGQDVVVQSIMDIILFQQTSIKLNYCIINSIKRYLEEHKSQGYRDWYYELNSVKKEQQKIIINPKIIQELWRLIFRLQNHQVKVTTENEKALYVSAYWQALKNIFYKKTHHLLTITPETIKANKLQISTTISFLERLVAFFDLKKLKTKDIQVYLYLQRQQKAQKQDTFEKFKNKQLQDLSNTKKMQETLQTQAEKSIENQAIIQSSLSLEKQLTEATSKIQAVIQAFIILAEARDNEKLVNLQQILRSNQNQRVLKEKLLESITDKNKLRELNAKLPQLRLEKDLNLLDWFSEMQNFQRLELIDLKKVASWLSSPYFERTLKIFQQRIDYQVQLLLYFRDICAQEVKFYSAMIQQENRRKNSLYSEDIKNMLGQKIVFFTNEQQKALDLVYQFIKTSISSYMKGIEESYSKAEKLLNNIIVSVNLQNDRLINIYLEEELIKIKVSEKINMVTKLKRKYIPPVTVEQHLLIRQPRNRTRPNVAGTQQ